MRGRVFLEPIEETDGLSGLVPDPGVLAFRGNAGDGDDYVCGGCKTTVLADAVAEGQVWDIAFRCPDCKSLGASPRLPAGRPLPQKTTLLPPG
jgi:hypothetical protein